MKVLVLQSRLFAKTPGHALADTLAARMRALPGVESEVISLPRTGNASQQIMDQMVAFHLLRLQNVDRVIALGFPECWVQHPDKVLWLLSLRDLTGSPVLPLQEAEFLMTGLRRCLRECRKVLASSAEGVDLLESIAGTPVERLAPPRPDEHEDADWNVITARLLA